MKQSSYFNLTHAQKRIFQMEQLYKGTSIANIGGTLLFSKPLDPEVMEYSLNKIIEVNDSFRIRLREIDGEVFQYVTSYNYQRLRYVDFRGKSKEEMDEWITSRMTTPFRLFEDKLCEFTVLRTYDGMYGVLSVMHHLVADAWTFSALGEQIIQNYIAISSGKKDKIEKKPSYLEYIESEQKYLESPKYVKERDYWLRIFSPVPEPTFIKSRDVKSFMSNASRMTMAINGVDAEEVRGFCLQKKISPAVLFEAVFAVYLSKLLCRSDITIGSSVLNRSGAREKSIAGMFISTVPLRIGVSEEDSFTDFCYQLVRLHRNVLKNQKYPFDLLLEELRKKNGYKHALFDVSISYQNAKVKKYDEYETKTEWYFNGHIENSLNFHITDRDDTGNYLLIYDYLCEQFDQTEVKNLHKRIMQILFTCIRKGEMKIKDLAYITEEEKHKIINEFNCTEKEFPVKKTLQQLFKEQAQRTPDKTAVLIGNEHISYKDLDCKSDKLALLLRTKGVTTNQIVGIMTDRSIQMILGILSILKAGGAYMPIEPSYPQERIGYMIRSCDTKLVLTSHELKCKLPSDCTVIDVYDKTIYDECHCGPVVCSGFPDDLIYVIFTSGTTGDPKGVMVKQKSFVNLINWYINEFSICENDSVFFIASTCFDLVQKNLFATLLKGGKLFLLPAGHYDYKYISDNIFSLNLTLLNCTPSAFYPLLEINSNSDFRKLKPLRKVFLGGEPINVNRIREWVESKNCRCEVVNTYGPTECTDISNSYILSVDDFKRKTTVPIGKPIYNVKVFIVNKMLNLVSVGETGELCIGGAGLSNGYLNSEQLNAEKFIRLPQVPTELVYRTGDFAKWLPDGNLEFIGRIDHQVKIRGFRVELLEIENALLHCEDINEAIVVARDNKKGEKCICAYYVADQCIEIESLKKDMQKSLPNYMIPQHFIQLNRFPLNQNGKVDRKALPEPEAMHTFRKYVSPQSLTEIKLEGFLKELLQTERVGINDDFFDHLGMDSLSVISFSARISKELHIDVSASDIYGNSTIAELAMHIGNSAVSEDFYEEHDMVVLKRGSCKSSHLFFIHDGHNRVDSYFDLCRSLSVNANCWGLKAPSFEYLQNLSIEEIACEYIRRIKKVQLTGKYTLVGWSLGGILAFEIARQLELSGNTVNKVILFDTVPPQNRIYEESDLAQLHNVYNEIKSLDLAIYEKVQVEMNRLKESLNDSTSKIFKFIPENVVKMIQQFQNTSIKQLIEAVSPIAALTISVKKYRPATKLKSVVEFYKAEKSLGFDEKEWSQYCLLPVVYQTLNGDHFTMISGSYAKDAAEIFS